MKKRRLQPAVLYHRVSTLDQDAQLARRELHDGARRFDFAPDYYITETGSGARNDRPGLAQVMELARRRKIRAVIVWKLDRFGRSVLDFLGSLEDLRHAGVRFIALADGVDVDPQNESPAARMFVQMLAVLAEFERGQIRQRTRLGLEKARRDGRRLGRPLSADAPDGERVAMLRRLRKSWTEIAKELGCDRDAARRALARLGAPRRRG